MFEECFAALTHPLPTLFLIIYMGKEKTFEIEGTPKRVFPILSKQQA
jgi:hypothetical protein